MDIGTHTPHAWEQDAQMIGEELGGRIFRGRNRSPDVMHEGYRFVPYFSLDSKGNRAYMTSCDVEVADGTTMSLFEAQGFIREQMNGAFVFREVVVATIIDTAMSQIHSDVETALVLNRLFDEQVIGYEREGTL